MSQLPPQAIEEFQALWKKHCSEELTLEEAATKAHDVFAVLRLALTEPTAQAKPTHQKTKHTTPKSPNKKP